MVIKQANNKAKGTGVVESVTINYAGGLKNTIPVTQDKVTKNMLRYTINANTDKVVGVVYAPK